MTAARSTSRAWLIALGTVLVLLVSAGSALAAPAPVNFAPPASYSAGTHPESVAVGDFNGDGIKDLAVADIAGTVSVLLGSGDGTFQPKASYPTGNNPTAVAVGDFNHDGIPDLAVTNVGDNTVSVISLT